MYPMRAVPLHQIAIHAPNVHPMAGPRQMQSPQGMADSHAFRMLLAQHLMNALQSKQGVVPEGRNPMSPTGVMA